VALTSINISKEEFDAMMQKSFDDIKAGRVRPIEDVLRDFEAKYGIKLRGK